MNELLEQNQVLSIVPKDFRNSNKGKVVGIQDQKFLLEIFHEPEGIVLKNVMEFYSQTKNGMLYFTSAVSEMNGNMLTVLMPRKHRFLQRRAFTRIKFFQDLSFELDKKTYKIKSLDLSAGGMKLKTTEHLDIDADYDLCINLPGELFITCKYQPLKIEKNEDESYTLSGRFENLANTDKMKLIQFCMRKNTENVNR